MNKMFVGGGKSTLLKILEFVRLYRRGLSLVKTIYFNFKVLPINYAIKLPFALGKNIEIQGIGNLKVVFKENIEPQRFMIKLGICNTKMIPLKGTWSLLRFEKGAVLVIGKDVLIAPGFSLNIYNNAVLTVGSDVLINFRNKIYCKNSITLNDHIRIGWENQIYDSTFHFIYNKKNNSIGNCYGRIEIGSYCWITNRCTLSGNVLLSPYSIIAANSLANKDYSQYTTEGNMFAGSPIELKTTGVYRIFNAEKQYELFCYFKNHVNNKTITMDEKFNIYDYLTTK